MRVPVLVVVAVAWSSSVDAAELFVDGANGACSDAGGHAAAQSEATPLCTMQPAADACRL